MDAPFSISPLYKEADIALNHFEGLIENYKTGNLKTLDLADLPTKLEKLSAAIDALSVQVYSKNLENKEFKDIIDKADKYSKKSIKIFYKIRNQNPNLAIVLLDSLQNSTCSFATQNREMLNNLIQQESAPLTKAIEVQKPVVPNISRVLTEAKRKSAVNWLTTLSGDKNFALKMVEKLDNEITFGKGLAEIVNYLRVTTTQCRSSYASAKLDQSKVRLGMGYSTQGTNYDYYTGLMNTADTKIDQCRWAGRFFCENILLTDAEAYYSD